VITSFFTKTRGAIKWAVIVFALVVVQGQLGFLGHEIPAVGLLHGLTALVLFGTALYAGRRMRNQTHTAASSAQERVTAPL
jgi:heme A synthase